MYFSLLRGRETVVIAPLYLHIIGSYTAVGKDTERSSRKRPLVTGPHIMVRGSNNTLDEALYFSAFL